ncbi:MAG: PQQ-binding-like beta-propeller repeat protein [Verrucomicrobiales bacterium]|nr:PQQ-binding-like beta-propeller repeat protein [Verrucomicrobiae bacterium]MCP5554008.1 PQQ-binding-like beta-propeller repeat protein [Akkermansiaceae bacterium]
MKPLLISRSGFLTLIVVLTMLSASWLSVGAAEWSAWRGPMGDGTWVDAPKLDRDPPEPPTVHWRRDIGSGYAGVTVAGGRVYTMDRQGTLPQVRERVLCFDAESGGPLWEHSWDANYTKMEYPSGPRASVLVHQGKAYAQGASGHLHCLDAVTGGVLWSLDYVSGLGGKRPTWGYAATPVIWKDLLLLQPGIPNGGGYLAVRPATGEEVWRTSGDPAGYCTPYLFRHRDRDFLALWTPKHLQLADPDTGKIHWSLPYEITYGVSIASPLYHQGLLLVSGYWHGTKTIRLGEGLADHALAWEENTHLRGLMSQPMVKDGIGHLLDKENGITCFDFATGRRLWDDAHEITPAGPGGKNPQCSLIRLRDSNDFLILNSEGELLLATLDDTKVTVHWREPVIGSTWAHPACGGHRIYLRDDTALVAVNLPIAK